ESGSTGRPRRSPAPSGRRGTAASAGPRRPWSRSSRARPSTSPEAAAARAGGRRRRRARGGRSGPVRRRPSVVPVHEAAGQGDELGAWTVGEAAAGKGFLGTRDPPPRLGAGPVPPACRLHQLREPAQMPLVGGAVRRTVGEAPGE